MRILLILFLLIPFVSRASDDEVVYVYANGNYVTMHTQPDGSKHYTEWSTASYFIAPTQVRYWTNYTWSNANGNILVNSTNYPTLTAGDTVFIPFKSGGYRSFSFLNLGTENLGAYIVIMFDPTAFITPSVSPIFANAMGNDNWVMVVGMTMNDNIDVAFSSYRGTAYSHHIYFKNFTGRGMNGFFVNSSPSGSSFPDWTGGADTTNCYYAWTFDGMRLDSIIGNNKGQTALWIGALDKKEAWARLTIKNSYFGHYRSPTSPETGNPATYVRLTNVWGAYIYNNQFEELGMNQPQPVGHAAQILIVMCYWESYNNFFGLHNFGNCIRNFGGSGMLYDDRYIKTWSPGYDGVSKLYNNLDIQSLKYPFYEENASPTNAATLGYCVARYYAYVYNNTLYMPFVGIGQDPYVNSVVDKYAVGTDTVFAKNNCIIGPIDTVVFNACNFGGGLNQGCSKLFNVGTGSVSRWDTASNRFVANSLLAGFDSVLYQPLLYGQGQLFGQGVPVPPWISTDYSGNSRTQGRSVDVGAKQYPAGFKIRRTKRFK